MPRKSMRRKSMRRKSMRGGVDDGTTARLKAKMDELMGNSLNLDYNKNE